MISSVIEGVEHESVVRFEISGRDQKFLEKISKICRKINRFLDRCMLLVKIAYYSSNASVRTENLVSFRSTVMLVD